MPPLHISRTAFRTALPSADLNSEGCIWSKIDRLFQPLEEDSAQS